MTMLTALARARAAETGSAQLIRTVRHVHLSTRPLVFIPLQLAGEACAPLAALVGDDPGRPVLLAVHEPRDREQRAGFTAALADIMVRYIDSYAAGGLPSDGAPYPNAPQLLVPNAPAVEFTRLLGRSTRFRQTEGEYAVKESVPRLGRWLTFYAERAESPVSALLVALTDALSGHWATGQSPAEDANLAALLGWIDPPPGTTGAVAARAAEDPIRFPPAGPATDPSFDNEVLTGRIGAVRAARTSGDTEALLRARSALEAALRTQLEPTWELMWRGIARLRMLPAGTRVAERWKNDRFAFTSFATRLREGGPPQPRRDGAVAAAAKLARLERDQQRLNVQRAYDDPLVMAEYRLTGEAFAGTVTDAEPERLDTSGKRPKLRPRITLETAEPVLMDPGTVLVNPVRPGQAAEIIEVMPPGPAAQETQGVQLTQVIVELSGGMGRSLIPPPGSVPAVGEPLTYTTLRDDFGLAPTFPDAEQTPWTHGGPPAQYGLAETDDQDPADDETAEELP
jgi:hypothetical protein